MTQPKYLTTLEKKLNSMHVGSTRQFDLNRKSIHTIIVTKLPKGYGVQYELNDGWDLAHSPIIIFSSVADIITDLQNSLNSRGRLNKT